ncbi:MAG: NDP-sugar synthase [Chloroflexi bacterium]|nr:NDP-sugar synthase [Chloroflexota bacterium]
MKALILVGGEGTRLRPLTANVPKSMVPVVNRPFLEHMLEYLKKHHITEIVLALCYLPDHIQHHFGDGHDFGVKLTYVVEECPMGTAGAVKNAAQYLDDTFAVFNGDVFTDLDLTTMAAFHKENQALVTIALTPVEDPTMYGVVETDSQHRILRFIEKPSWDAISTNMINAGTYIMEPSVLDHIPAQTWFQFEQDVFPALLRHGELLYGYPSQTYWLDIGTPEKYLMLHHDLLLGRCNNQSLREGGWLGSDCDIHPTARLTGPVVVGENCVIGPRARIIGPTILGHHCTIGKETIVEGAIIWPETKLGDQVNVKGCIIGQNTIVGDNCWIMDGCVLGDNVTLGDENKLERGIRIWPSRTLAPHTITFDHRS